MSIIDIHVDWTDPDENIYIPSVQYKCQSLALYSRVVESLHVTWR